MKRRILNKENVSILLSILIGSIYFLSTIGKFFDLFSFQKIIMTYGFPYYFSYIVLIIELIFSICFIFLLFLRVTAFLSIGFIILLTITHIFGHYFLNIDLCECSGMIYFLNPSNFIVFLCKNAVLILISFYIFRNQISMQHKMWLKRILTVTISLITVFICFQYNTYFVDNYAKRKINLRIESLNISSEKIKGFDFLLFFSPTCSHCKKAIININSLKNRHSLKIVGIISDTKVDELKSLTTDLTIEFPIVTIDSKAFKDITKIVPIVFKIENDTIRNVLEIKEFLRMY